MSADFDAWFSSPPRDDDTGKFLAIYGRWRPLSMTALRRLMRGFPHPWWLVGGHAMEAFTGVRRPHEDIDISFFPNALPDFRRQLSAFHLWSNHGGVFRILDDEHPESLDPLAQVWVRRNAGAPWVVDASPSPSANGLWQSKRHPGHVAGLDEVTWVSSTGLRALNPEIALLYKAKWDRAKDRFDLRQAWPLMDARQQGWLRDAVLSDTPDHAWRAILALGP